MSELQKRIQYIFFALALILSISCSTLSSLVSGDSLKAPSLFSGPSFEVISPLNFERLSLLAKVPFFIDCHSYFMDEKKTVLFCDSVIAIYSTLKPEPHPIKVQETSSIQWTAFSPDWTRMVAVLGYGEKSTLWDLEKGVRISEFPVEITKAVFSPDGKTIATVNVWPDKDNATVRLWDASDGKAIRALSIENHSGSDVAFSDDGKTIAVGTFMPGDAFLWDMHSDQPSIYFPADSSMWVGFSATEKMIITGWGDFHVWDIASGKELTFLQSAHNGNVQGVAFNPDDSLIATWGEDRKARVWETAGGVERSFENLSDSIIGDAGFSPDGKRFSVLNKNTISEWDAATGKLLVSADLTTDCGELKALNPDWQLAVCAAKDGTLMVWDILEGKALTVLKVEKQFSLQGKYIQFSSDGKLLSADYSGYLDDEYVWRLLVFGVR
jgi:WD40 repeat protein